ncbi:YadA C-terminal domain-containing protein [Vibrio campbellii]|uniref:YadA C-terminal domain-containing protein n=1 Tax=Vibrio campbellii TaxID=680 RepID=UPI0006801307|nr:YadA C-terminal domain-containing protein [Vibrio campbellii]
MNKTILAVSIAAISANSLASGFELPTPDQKIDALEQILVSKGAVISENPAGNLKTVSIVKDGEVHTVTFDTVTGQYMHNGSEFKKIDRTHLGKIQDAGKDIVLGWTPIVEPAPNDQGEKGASKFNSLMEKADKNARISNMGNGNYQVTFKDGQGNTVIKEITPANYAEVIAKASQVKEGLKDNLPIVDPIDPGFGVDPIDPGFGVDPINPPMPPIEVPVDEKVALFNEKIESLGGQANIEKQGENYLLSYVDPRTGELSAVLLDETTDVDELKDLAKDIVIGGAPGVDPIDVVLPPDMEVPILDPIDVIIEPVPNEQGDKGAAKFNALMERANKDARISNMGNGNFQVTFKDGQGNTVIKEITPDNYAEVIAKASQVKEGLKNNLPGVDPIDVIIDPIIGGPDPVNPIPAPCGIDDVCVPDYGDPEAPVIEPGKGIGAPDWKEEKKAEVKEKLEEVANKRPVGIDPIEARDPENNGKVAQAVVNALEEKADDIREENDGEKAKNVTDTLQEKVDELKVTYTGDAAKAAYENSQIAQASMQADIDSNSQQIEFLWDKVDELEEKMDGVVASAHAIANARPYLAGEGDTSVGAGVGFAGGSSAVAVGAAHAFTNQLSASMTLNVTTGSYSEVSGGAGIHYQF